MKNIKNGIAVVGIGHWGPNYIKTLLRFKNVEILWVCDKNQEAFNTIPNLKITTKKTSNIEDVLSDKLVNAVIIATPASTHYNLIKQCLKAKKHVLAEKPLTLDLKEAIELDQLSHETKKYLMVGHTFLYNPAILEINKLIKKGKLGKIYYLNATRTHLGLIRSDVNAIWDLAPHDVSIFNFFLDSVPISVNAIGASHLGTIHEDMAFINLIYPNNVIANIHVSWEDSNKERTVRVVGSHARAVFDDLNNLEKIKIYEKGLGFVDNGIATSSQQLVLRDGDIISPLIDSTEPLFNMCNYFLELIKGVHGENYGCKEGIDNIKVMCAIQRSITENGLIQLI